MRKLFLPRYLEGLTVKLFDPVPVRTVPPNALTATALGFGMASIWLSISGGSLQTAAWFVLLSTLLDKLDGSVARLIGGQSEFGVQFDSFADNIAFGLAPAALVFTAASTLAPTVWGPSATMAGLPAGNVLAAICLAYGILTSVRLARFNVTTDAIGPNLFLGLPSTLSGGLIASAFLTVFELHLDGRSELFAFLPILVAISGLAMVCNLPLPKMKFSTGSMPVRVAKILAAGTVYVAVLARVGFTAVMVLILGYLLIGFVRVGPRQLAAETAKLPSEKS